MALSPSQQQIAARILEIGQQRGMSQKQIQAALSAGWVESRLQNLNYGDRDSLGVFQQRPSQGWGSPSEVTDLDHAINAFYDAAARINDSGMTFGQLAQAVQRSAFPARYDAAGSIVDSILRLFGSSSGGAAASGNPDDASSSNFLENLLPAGEGSPSPALIIGGLVLLWLFLK